MPPSVTDPLTLSKAGMSRQWAATLREAVRTMEGRDVNFEQITHTVMPPGLHLDHGLDCRTRRVDDIAPTLTSPLLSGLIDNICHLEEPAIPGKPVSFKVDKGLWGLSGGPPKPDAPGPSHNDGMASKMPISEGEVPKIEPWVQGESTEDQPLFEIAEIIISESDEGDIPIEVPQPEAASTLRSEPAKHQKQSPEDQGPHLSPPKKWATWEDKESMPEQEAALPRGLKMDDILPGRYETLTADNNWAHRVRCSLLGLEAGTTTSKEDINTSERFMPRAAAWELEPPEVIADHWLPILQEEGLLAECPLDQFKAEADWVPLYTKDSLEKHLPAALSAFMNAGPPSLTAVVPPGFHVGTDKEFLLMNFHWPGCLARQSISIGGRHRQMAFCPYCGVFNENWETTLSQVRKHLDLLFVCGGCFSKSFSSGPALHKHMKSQCHSVMAIRDNSRSSWR